MNASKSIAAIIGLCFLLACAGELRAFQIEKYDLTSSVESADYVGEGVVVSAVCEKIVRSPGCAEVLYRIRQDKVIKGISKPVFEIRVHTVADQSVAVGAEVLVVLTREGGAADGFDNSVSQIVRISMGDGIYKKYLVLSPVSRVGSLPSRSVRYQFDAPSEGVRIYLSDPSLTVYEVLGYSEFLAEIKQYLSPSES